MGLGAELRQPGGAGGVHVGDDVEAIDLRPGRPSIGTVPAPARTRDVRRVRGRMPGREGFEHAPISSSG